jgi:hypothetical protein
VNTEDGNEAQGLKIAQNLDKKIKKRPASTQQEQRLDFTLKFKEDPYNHRGHHPLPYLIEN